ncbi:hypothetical protein AB0E96_30405 [Kitasatospora sp. NPDC036755]|uniref:hypothetical protein n=1 Tax=Kitasatospora sp. NPDC036755 TaxID=3154600 RepID=UPI0033FB5AB4
MDERTTPHPTVGATVHQVHPDGTAGPALADGLLLSPRTVLVPDPPPAVGDPWQSLAVRITEDPGPDGGAEALRVAGISLAAFTDDGFRAAASFLTLRAPSQLPTGEVEFTRDQLVAAIRDHHGDLWAAYAALGYPVRSPAEHATAVEPWWSDVRTGGLPDLVDRTCCDKTNTLCCRELQL